MSHRKARLKQKHHPVGYNSSRLPEREGAARSGVPVHGRCSWYSEIPQCLLEALMVLPNVGGEFETDNKNECWLPGSSAGIGQSALLR